MNIFQTSDVNLLNKSIPDKQYPFLLCCMVNEEKRGTFYVKTKGHMFEVGDDPSYAVDVLVKLHLCFNIPVSPDLTPFFDFITGCIMKLNEPNSSCVALHSTLSNVLT